MDRGWGEGSGGHSGDALCNRSSTSWTSGKECVDKDDDGDDDDIDYDREKGSRYGHCRSSS